MIEDVRVDRKFLNLILRYDLFTGVLPVNILFEKFYVLLWCWFFITWVLTLFNTLLWFYRMIFPWNREQFIKKYMKLAGKEVYSGSRDKKLLEKFVTSHLGFDGLLILRLLSINVGLIFTLEVIKELWKLFQEKYEGIIN